MERLPATLNKNKALKVEDAAEDNDSPRVKTDASPDRTDTVEDWIQTKNPLQNQLILRHLFALCPAHILASCRLVCKSWYHESLVTWRTEFPLKFKAKGNELYLGKSSTPVQNFLEFVDKPENQCSVKPYRNIQIMNFAAPHHAKDIIWKAIGSNLTSLQLEYYHFRDVEEFRHLTYKCCPKLKKLMIICPTLRKSSRENQNWSEYKGPVYGEHKHLKYLLVQPFIGHQFPVSWIELFSHFSSLTSFKINRGYAHPDRGFDALMDAISVIRRQSKTKLPFQRFDHFPPLSFSSDPISAGHFAVIRELRLPLNNVDILVDPKIDENLSPLVETLTVLSRSVNRINFVNPTFGTEEERLNQAPSPTLLIKDFPFGIQLDKLGAVTMERCYFESFEFIKYTPNLSSLFVYDAESNYNNKFTTKAISNTNLEELPKMPQFETFHLDAIVSEHDLQRLFNWMPNIKQLGLVLNDKQFGMVCQNWGNLKHLEVFGQELTNEGVTGIKEGEGANAVLYPNISNLSNLETFHYDTSKLTAESVLHLLLQLPRLRDVQRWALLPRGPGCEILHRKPAKDKLTDLWKGEKVQPVSPLWSEEEKGGENAIDLHRPPPAEADAQV